MKKLSIVLALIMALSCFCFTAFAEGEGETTTAPAEIETTTAPETTTGSETTTKETTTKETTTAAPVNVKVTVVAKDFEGFPVEVDRFPYDIDLNGYKAGSTIKADTILNLVKAKVDGNGNKIIDPEKYVVSNVVVLQDKDSKDGTEVSSVTLANDRECYEFIVYIFQINHVENLAQVAATEIGGKVDWKGIASANTGLINQVINGAKAAADSLAKADYPEIGEKKTEDAANKSAGSVKGDKVVMTPKTGASAAAGVAVVVLALSATTAVVLRKKED